MSQLWKDVNQVLIKFRDYKSGPRTTTALFKALQMALETHLTETDDASGPEDPKKYDKIMTTEEPKMFCTNCGQKFVPETNDYSAKAESTYPAAEWKDVEGVEENTDDCFQGSLAVDLDFPNELDQIHSDLNLFQEIVLNKRLPKGTKNVILQELHIMINTNMHKLVFKGLK